MTIVAGGTKMNLVTGLLEGDDDNTGYGKNVWLAQTFTLTEQTIVWRFLVKSWTIDAGEFYYYDLHRTDGLGQPFGPPIASTTLSPTGESSYSPGKWRRFDFNSFPSLAAGTYAIVLHVPGAASTSSHKLRCDTTLPPYTGGKAWRSDDTGGTWNEIAGTDFLFQVWGYVPPPEAPPPPAISNWAPLDITSVDDVSGMTIVVRTDIPCHLYMRWTNTEPLKHPSTEYRRGLLIQTGTYFCFVAWHENEQLEPGDTLIHTFFKPNWKYCETRWFYFIGTKQAEESPSASPIFFLHKEVEVMQGPYYLTVQDKHWTKYLHRYVSGQTYTQCHESPVASAINASGNRPVNQAKTSTNKYWLRRKPLYFDVTALPANAFISSAVMHQYGAYPVAGVDKVHLFRAPDLNDPPVLADYGYVFGLTTDPLFIIDEPTMELYRNRHWLIPKAGLDDIKAGGVVKWAARCEHDVDVIPPVDATGFGWIFTSDPTYLIITYWLPV